MRVGGRAQEENGCRACRPWAERGAEDAAGGDDGAKKLGVEEFGDEICDGHGAPADEIEHSGFAEAGMPRPVLRRFQRSSGEGESMEGGVVERS